MKLVFDYEKLPCPQRNAALGILLMLSFLRLAVTPVVGPLKREPKLWERAYCFVMPWNCGDGSEQAERKREHQRKYRVMQLAFLPGANGKHECSCHFDLQFKGKAIQHFPSYSESCDSDPPRIWDTPDALPNTWIAATMPTHDLLGRDLKSLESDGVSYSTICIQDSQKWTTCMHPGQGQFRWHCE